MLRSVAALGLLAGGARAQEAASSEGSCDEFLQRDTGVPGGTTIEAELQRVVSICAPSGAIDVLHCSPTCAEYFSPFWKACSARVMLSAKNKDYEGLPTFAQACEATDLVSKGFVHRAACDASTYDTRLSEMQSICCVHANDCHSESHTSGHWADAAAAIRASGHGASLPSTCSLECSVVFSEFYEDCVHQISEQNTREVARAYDHFYRTCIDEADPATLLSVLSALNTQGCMVDENLASTSAAHIEGGQVWVGSYLCSQGDTDLQLEITEVDSDGNVAAVFDCKCSSFVGFSTSLNRSCCSRPHRRGNRRPQLRRALHRQR